MTTYANRVTAKYLELRAAREAGGAPIDFLSGTLVVGDAGAPGAPPTLSALIAADGVLHEVWRGDAVVSCAPNATDDTQIDIGVVIPAAIGGHEVGPFQINEFALLDAAGECLVVGQLNNYKGTAATGLPGDLAFIVQIGASATDVVISPPGSSIFITEIDVRNAINAHQPTAEPPLTQTDSMVAGWLHRVFGIRGARKPRAAGPAVLEADATGYGRPLSDAEFTAGAVDEAASYKFPWVTLDQLLSAISGFAVYGALFPLIKNGTLKRYEIANASVGAVGAVRLATSAEVAARATNPAGGGPCAVRPEDIPTVGDPWGTGIGATIFVSGYGMIDNIAAAPIVGKTLTVAEVKSGKLFPDAAFVTMAMTNPAAAPNWGGAPATGGSDSRYDDLTGKFRIEAYTLSAYKPTDVYNPATQYFVVRLKRYE